MRSQGGVRCGLGLALVLCLGSENPGLGGNSGGRLPETSLDGGGTFHRLSAQDLGTPSAPWGERLSPNRSPEELKEVLLALRVQPSPGSPELVGALIPLAGWGPNNELGALALEVLGALDNRAACMALVTLARGLQSPLGARVLSFLPDSPSSLGPLTELLDPEIGPGKRESSAALTAAAIARLAPLLAHGAAPANGPMELVFAGRRVDPLLRAAGARGLQTLVARLNSLGDAERLALRGEALLRADGESRWLLMDLARIALIGGGDWELAHEWSRALLLQIAGIQLVRQGSFEARLMVGRVHLLAAIVAVGAGNQDASREHLALAHQSIRSVINARGDRNPARSPQVSYAQAMQVRALLLLADLYGELLLHPSGDRAALLPAARELHQASLEVDAARARFMPSSTNTWDAVLRADMSIVLLLLDGQRMPGLAADAGLAARQSLGRLLATVAGREMPGFEPYACEDEQITNPLSDPGRVQWLDVQRWSYLHTSERNAQKERAAVEPLRVPFVLDRETYAAEQRRATQLRFARSLAQNPLDEDIYSRLRWPSDMALRIAADLRVEGRPKDALRLAERYGRHMAGASDTPSWFLLVQFQQAQGDLQAGTAYTDMDEPLRAEESLLQGVERIESLMETIETRRLGAAFMAQAREQLAGLLVSLAVNANVKLGQPHKAVAWVERAHELRADASSTILLACYRARAGRLEEARDLLAQISPEPGVEYNLACTHALLGNREAALEWLGRALREPGASAGGLRREKDWAARDPDLLSLREDARFRALIE